MAKRAPDELARLVVDALCAGDPFATAQRLAAFQSAFTLLAAERLCGRVLVQRGLEPEWPPRDELSDDPALREARC